MKKIMALLLLYMAYGAAMAQSPVGRWKIISHTIVFEGKPMDTHAALLQQRPCAAKIAYDINANGTYRLDASQSGCDEKYKKVQEKLWSQTQWRLTGNTITLSSTNFAVGQSYTVTFSGNKMTWTGAEGQGVMVYQKL
jgi:Lipocalin-like domain